VKANVPLTRGTVLGGLAAIALVAGGCGSATEPPSEERRPGLIIGFRASDPQIVVPDTVQAGVAFPIEVTTYGDTCYSKGPTEVTEAGNRVTITPYDYVDLGRAICQRILLSFVHRVTFHFSEPGPASVVISGRSAGSIGEGPIEVVREVMVVEGASSDQIAPQ